MKSKNVLKTTLIAAAVAGAGMTAPMVANAEVSASLGASRFYLWRGQDVSNSAGVIHGSLDYSHDSGLYAGVWGSSEGALSTVGGEYDVYAGFAGEAGGLSYDVSYISYIYPGIDQGIGEAGDFILGLGLSGFSLTYYASYADDNDGDKAFGDLTYVTLGYAYDKFGFLVGQTINDADDTDYTHVDLSYSPIENLTFTLSKVVDSDDLADVTDDQDPLFHVSYSFVF